MRITAPFGYDDIVPLEKQHRVLMPSGTTPAFCRRLNALALSFTEFSVASRDYPIVFTTLDGGKSYAPVIVLGLADGSNLFLDAGGEWDSATYLPAFVRRYPFCVSKLYVDGEPNGESVVCVAKAYIDSAGVALFDGAGKPTERWSGMERLLAEYEADLDRTAQMCAALARLKLFVPFTMQVVEDSRPGVRLAGMHRIDEARLKDLKPASLKVLVNKDFMPKIYAHLQSLDNFSRLYTRQVAAQARPATDSRRAS
jgi:hypothetical protein